MSRFHLVRIDSETYTRRFYAVRVTVFQMAEVAVPQDLFGRVLKMIENLRPQRMARC